MFQSTKHKVQTKAEKEKAVVANSSFGEQIKRLRGAMK